MFQYRQVLVRLRQGDSDRDVARARLMGRPKVAALRALAEREGWIAADRPLPEDAVIAAAIGQARRARSTISTAEPYRELIARWAEQGINGVVTGHNLPLANGCCGATQRGAGHGQRGHKCLDLDLAHRSPWRLS